MRAVFLNEPNHKYKSQYLSNGSPTKNFFYQNAGSSLIKSLISTNQTKASSSQHSNSKSPTTKLNNTYQKYMAPSSASKQRQSQTDTKQQSTSVNQAYSQSLQKKSSTPTLYTTNDDTKKKDQHRRQVSHVVGDSNNTRPDSGVNKKFTETPQGLSQAQTLMQKIRDQQMKKPLPQQSQLLQYHQELIDKQYKKLLELQQQHYQTFKQSNPTETKSSKVLNNGSGMKSAGKPQQHQQLSTQLGQYMAFQTAKNLKGQRSISTPDIGSQVLKRLSYINKTFVLTQPGITHTGQVKTNQDSYYIKQNVLGKPNCWILQVSDGHGTNGHFVAQFIKEKLPQQIEFQLKQKKVSTTDFCSDETNSLVTNALKQSFEKTTRDLYSSGIDITFSGATTVTVVILENEICGCIPKINIYQIVAREMDRAEYQVIEISNDHKPDLPTEMKRILSSGGRVQSYSDQNGNPIGPARVWIKEENIPGLAMSRSFGDYVASQVGVISSPEIIKHTLRPQDKFIVIASDGIWEFLSNEWIIQTVAQYYQKKDIEGACQRLVEEATLAWEREDEVVDDITCLIAFIGYDGSIQMNQVSLKF